MSMDFKAFNAPIIEEFRANGGKVGGYFEGAPMVLLTTTGRKSGRPHLTPLVALHEEGRTYVFASKGGAPSHPSWYLNIAANPAVTVEIGTETKAGTAVALDEPERTRVYAKQAELFDNFREYAEMTDRVIPVIELKLA